VHGVESALASHRKLCLLRHFPTDAAPSRSLFPQKVDGVLIFGSVEEEVDCPELKELPCVQMMGTMRGLPWDHVTYDNEVVGKLAAEYLLSRGHRTVAMLAPDDIPKRNPGSSTLHGRRDSFCRTMAAANAHVNLVWGPFADTHLQPDRQTLEQVIDALLAAQPVPTGLFCPYDLWTACLYPLLYARGIQPGRDLDIVSCNNEVVFLQNLFPRPATVDIHAYDVGRRAVEQLLWRIEHQSAPRNTIAIQPSVVVAEK
jgi:LacI family transcriptional regulator